ncbi:MAG: ABC transporter ATP-binding protein [Lachnospiraceae bacterium]|nr:ABC transporter ATP-binding protein [Lachnospiraceae bacterium]
MEERILLETKGLTKLYKNKVALDQVDLSVTAGKIIGLLGSNGSGKTTLIKLLNGLLTPTAGEAKILGQPISAETKKHVAYLPERTYLKNNMKVESMIRLFEDFYEDFNKERAYEMLKHLNINPKDCFKTMSKGTREKVQLILVMSRDADLYLLDEPIGGVDPAGRDYILNMIVSNYNPEATIILSTHLISDIENYLDEVIFIRDGRIILQKTVEEIREEEGKSVDGLFREVYRC